MSIANNIEINPNCMYTLAGDISASMQTVDAKCAGLNRYQYMLEKFESFIKEAEDFDPDGPTVMLFGENVHVYPNTKLIDVMGKLSKPSFEGYTNTHLVVQRAYDLHKAEKSVLAKDGKAHPGTVLFIFTDGQPTNQAALERTIVDIANNIDREDEFNIGFMLVGTITQSLREYLDHLDDGLKGKVKYDIVGTKEIEGITFLKAVHNAVNE